MATEKRLIDANALYLGKFVHAGMSDYKNGWNDALDAATTQADTVDAVEVVHGRWVNWGKSGTPTYENYGTCSVCHEDAEINTEHRNYCPNCGAKMDGGKDNG